MSYLRVIPRDLFNEASLLKCYGLLVIMLGETDGHHAEFEDQLSEFDVVQRDYDGAIYMKNMPLKVGDKTYHLIRPLNSREPLPLYAEEVGNNNFEPVEVFDEHGNLTPEMLALISHKL